MKANALHCKGESPQLTTYLCPLDEITENGKEVVLPGEPPLYLMLFKRGGQLLGFHNVCPHAGRSLNWAPDQFLFSADGLLVCPHHGAVFDLARDGVCRGGPCPGASLSSIELEVRDDQVYRLVTAASTGAEQ